jgi:hypothetical protein
MIATAIPTITRTLRFVNIAGDAFIDTNIAAKVVMGMYK